jgi:hypothetical protein
LQSTTFAAILRDHCILVTARIWWLTLASLAIRNPFGNDWSRLITVGLLGLRRLDVHLSSTDICCPNIKNKPLSNGFLLKGDESKASGLASVDIFKDNS